MKIEQTRDIAKDKWNEMYVKIRTHRAITYMKSQKQDFEWGKK